MDIITRWVPVMFLRKTWNENKSKIVFNLIIQCGFYSTIVLNCIKATHFFKKKKKKDYTVINSALPFSAYVQSPPKQNNRVKDHLKEEKENFQWFIYYLWKLGWVVGCTVWGVPGVTEIMKIRFLGILTVEGKRKVMGVWRQEEKRASFSESREEEGRVHEGR